MRGPWRTAGQWLSLLLALCALLTACPPARKKPAGTGRPPAPWMEVEHSGPFSGLGDPSLGLSERCTACHQFGALSTLTPLGNPHEPPVELDSAASRPRPPDPLSVTAAHPGGWLRWHNPARFGCTVCHGGNGQGISYSGAGHARMLPAKGADGALSQALQARCGTCHGGEYVPSAPLLSRGRTLIRELNCGGCHELGAGFSGTAPGPSLARVAEKLAPEVLFNKPLHAVDWQQPVTQQMPQFDGLSVERRAALTAYLQSLTEPAVRQAQLPDSSAVQADPAGLELVRSARCANCHELPVSNLAAHDPLRAAVPVGRIGPSLARIHERVSVEWIADYLAAPSDWYPQTRMPAYPLAPEQRRALANWLVASARAQARLAPARVDAPAQLGLPDSVRRQLAQPDAALLAQGRTEFASLGCAGCHNTGDPQLAARKVGPSLLGIGDKRRELWPDKARADESLGNLADYLHWSVAEPRRVGPGLMPRYGLEPVETAGIVTALLAETARMWPGTQQPLPAQYARRLDELPSPPDPAGDGFARDFWRFPAEPQGPGGPASQPGVILSLAERDLRPQACGTCHREEYVEWQRSRHALAMGPGVTGQLTEWVDSKPEEYHSCLKCHASQAEQSHIRRTAAGQWEDNPHYAGDELYIAGNTCASCHVRAHERFGPTQPRMQPVWQRSGLSAHVLRRTSFLASSEFCAACHQFDPAQRITNGPPLQNTHVEHGEWLARTARPQTCQACHMPRGSHSFKGIHDARFVGDSLDITHAWETERGRVKARIMLVNARNGHHFPTYVTPRVFLRGYFTDSGGKQIAGTLKESVIGRDARNRRTAEGGMEWYDVFDTRVPAGGSFDFSYDEAVPSAARAFRLEVFCAPDHFYHEAYGQWLEQDSRSAAGLAQLHQAQAETAPERSGFYLLKEEFSLGAGES